MLLCNLAASGGTKGGHGPRRRPKGTLRLKEKLKRFLTLSRRKNQEGNES